ncbi:folate transporter 1 [Salarias fasciatus]|uniref:Solute carrier family 19 member 1 n=1 Tax=Salarias fasciatus TaxID=181472 RepID=A0A672FGL9_SALFA|nr:folate transporter 1 [Salarias fasciatus]
MAADDTVGGEDQLERDRKTDAEVPPSEDGSVEAAAPAVEAQSPDDPPEEVKDRSKWKMSVIYLCVYGFMASIKPGEPFITPLLLSDDKNFTMQQVTNEITPVLTYSYMAVLVPAFLLTDLLRYKPVLIVQGVSQAVIWVILLRGDTLLQMQFMEFFYGITMACRLAYSSYIFSLVNLALYQRVASYSRTSVLLGVFMSSVLGQLCKSVGQVSYFTLNAISLGFTSFGLLLSLCLPWPKRSLFFNRTKEQEQSYQAALAKSELDRMNPKEGAPAPASASASCWKDSVFLQMLLELKNVAKRPNLRLWSLWWIFNSTGYYLVLFYVHILWSKVQKDQKVYNGAVEAASTLLSAMTSFTAGYVKIKWNVWSELVIGVITAAQAGLLLLMQTTNNVWVCYVAYVLFRGFYQFLVPIATFQIASSLTKELCALVFGINTFLGTVLKSIINLIFSDKRGLGLDVHDQFLVYFFYLTILTLTYFTCAAVVIFRHFRRQSDAGGGGGEQATPTELLPVPLDSEEQPLSNGNSVKA